MQKLIHFIPIIVFAVGVFIAIVYTICVWMKKRDEIWNWLHSLIATFVSVLIGVTIAISLFFLQNHYTEQLEKEKYCSLLMSELTNSYRALTTKGEPLRVYFDDEIYSFHHITILQTIALEDAARSGLFDEIHTTTMLAMARVMRQRNMEVELFLNLLSQSNPTSNSTYKSMIKMMRDSLNKTKFFILHDIALLDRELNLNFPRIKDAIQEKEK